MEASMTTSFIMTIGDSDLQKLAVRWNNDDTHLAAACEDGTVRIYSADTGHFQRSLNCRMQTEGMPVTSLRWRPYSVLNKTKHVLVSVSSEGAILHWHAASGKLLSKIVIEDVQLLSIDYRDDATQFAVGGRDAVVRIIDEATKAIVSELSNGGMTRQGHVNSIFSVKWYDESTLISGGWDRNLNFWDLRTARVEASFLGPNVCGDSIDSRGDTVLVGSHDVTNQIQLWSLRERRQVLGHSFTEAEGVTMVYAAQFSKQDGGRNILVGGSGANAAYFLRSGDLSPFSVVQLPTPCFSLDCSGISGRVSLGCGDGALRLYEMRTN
jgi:WD40 repeat protein